MDINSVRIEHYIELGASLLSMAGFAYLLISYKRQNSGGKLISDGSEDPWQRLAKDTGLSLDASGVRYHAANSKRASSFKSYTMGHADFEVYGHYKGVELYQRRVINGQRSAFKGPGSAVRVVGRAQLFDALPEGVSLQARTLSQSILRFTGQKTGDQEFDRAFHVSSKFPLEWLTPSLRKHLLELRTHTHEITLKGSAMSWVNNKGYVPLETLQGALDAASATISELQHARAFSPPHEDPSSLRKQDQSSARYTFPDLSEENRDPNPAQKEQHEEVEVQAKAHHF